MDETPARLHIDMTREQREKFKRMKGKRTWLEWLLSFQKQLNDLVERLKHEKARVEELEKENAELKEKIQRLQEMVEDV